MESRLRFRDLLEKKIVNNRPTLQNWIRDRGFPVGQMTGPNSRTWGEAEVEAWLGKRPTEKKVIPPSPKRRGRPRKHPIEAPTAAAQADS